MTKDGLVPRATKTADIGESKVKAKLQYISTVSKIERDVGIDFYCELLIGNKPVIPFYVQVKSSKDFDKTNGRSIKKETILYWLTRPHPVYLIFYDQQSDICFWYSVEEHRYDLIGKLFETDSKTIYISVDRTDVLENGDNDAFKERIEEDNYSLMTYRGMPQFKGREYVKRIPDLPRTDIEYSRIKENVRAGLYSLIYHHIKKGENDMAINLSEAVAIFDHSHYNHFAWLGYLYKEKGEFDNARKNFEKAIDILKRDTKWDRHQISEMVKRLQLERDSIS